MNFITLSDSYKVTHAPQYPKNTKNIYSYFESRGGLYPKTVFFGLQYILKEFFEGAIITEDDIESAEILFESHFGTNKLFNRAGWEYILDEYRGRLPLSIKAVPEGALIDNHNVLMSVENTDEKCFWLPNYVETLLVQVWYASTVATQSYFIKKDIEKFAKETGDPSLIDFKLHDFGFRGVSSVESAMIGGLAHLLNFKGTDTMVALICANGYYNTEKCQGFSIPAAEHSTITSWGKENEAKAMANMLHQYPEGLVAVVSDSYDIYNACENIWGGVLKDKVLKRNGCLVVRPDSGNPTEVVCKVLDILGEKLGYARNEKGYKVLDPHVRVIQGDGVNRDTIVEILSNMQAKGWSSDNIAFGMGGALLQKLDRDTQKFAFKCSAINTNNEWKKVWKDPITDKGKISKSGKFKLIPVDGGISYTTVNQDVPTTQEDVLVEVFRNGEIVKEYTFEECKANLYEKAFLNYASEGVK